MVRAFISGTGHDKPTNHSIQPQCRPDLNAIVVAYGGDPDIMLVVPCGSQTRVPSYANQVQYPLDHGCFSWTLYYDKSLTGEPLHSIQKLFTIFTNVMMVGST